jgi:salicylate hydroxylase
MHHEPVIVAGGGIGGLTAALALLHHGQRVTVLEQSGELREVGAGLTITPNGTRALSSLGLAGALDAIGSAPARGVIRHYASGQTLVPLLEDDSRARYGAPVYHVHRADLHGLLARTIESRWPGTVRTGCEITGIEQHRRAVTAVLHGGERVSGKALVGADGVRSRVRALCFGDDRARFSGFVAFRGLVPGDALAPELKDPPISFWVGPRRSFMRYRLRDGQLYNFVGIARRQAWAEEGWSVPAMVDEVLEEFHDFERRVHGVLHATPRERLFRWGIFEREPLPGWIAGRVTLLGDAAHGMPPFLGQGAVMAIEDAVVLGRAFAAASSVEDALARYEAARLPRTTEAMMASQAQGVLYHAENPAAQVAALGRSMVEQRALYTYDAGAVQV